MAYALTAAATQGAQYTTEIPATASRAKGFATRFFNKAAGIASRAAVTGAFRIAALSAVAGAGLSSVATLAVAAAAAGAGAAVYSYGRDTYTEWRSGGRIDWRDPAKLKRAKIALLTGVAGGAFGAWLAGTEFFQTGIDYAKNFAGNALSMLVPSAAAAELPAVALAAAPALEAKPNVLARLWDMTMHSEQAKGKFAAYMLKADPDDINSVTPQFLKDRAHDVLRLKDIPMQDRLAMAHDLAEAAKERGNRQAVQFLKDLVKLGYQPVVPAVAPVAEAVLPTVAEQAAPAVIAPAAVFNEAATCTVAGDAQGLYGVDCVTHRAAMLPGDYVSFVDKALPHLKVQTTLLPGSVDMPTESFLHETLMSDGVARLNVLRQSAVKSALGM